MSYPPHEGFPAHTTTPPPVAPAYDPAAAMPIGQHAIPSPATPAYSPPPLGQISGTPYRPPRAPGRSMVLALSIAAALLLIFGGLMLGFYLNERGNLSDTRSSLTSQVTVQKAAVADQQQKLTAAEKQATDLNAQLDKMKTNMTEVTSQRDVLTPCMRHFEAMLDAVSGSGFDASFRAAKAACDRAERKMDS